MGSKLKESRPGGHPSWFKILKAMKMEGNSDNLRHCIEFVLSAGHTADLKCSRSKEIIFCVD